MKINEVKCIQCGRVKAVSPMGENFWCDHCKIQFDPTDDSDIGYGSPERNAMNKEEYEMRRQRRASYKR